MLLLRGSQKEKLTDFVTAFDVLINEAQNAGLDERHVRTFTESLGRAKRLAQRSQTLVHTLLQAPRLSKAHRFLQEIEQLSQGISSKHVEDVFMKGEVEASAAYIEKAADEHRKGAKIAREWFASQLQEELTVSLRTSLQELQTRYENTSQRAQEKIQKMWAATLLSATKHFINGEQNDSAAQTARKLRKAGASFQQWGSKALFCFGNMLEHALAPTAMDKIEQSVVQFLDTLEKVQKETQEKRFQSVMAFLSNIDEELRAMGENPDPAVISSLKEERESLSLCLYAEDFTRQQWISLFQGMSAAEEKLETAYFTQVLSF